VFIGGVTLVGKVRINAGRCVGAIRCGVCLSVCPAGCFSIDKKNRKVVVVNEDACMECYACKVQCKYDAVELGF